MKSLDAKLAAYRENPAASDSFVIADAKDPDMAFGVRALGHRRYLSSQGAHPAQFSPEIWSRDEFGYRNLPGHREVLDYFKRANGSHYQKLLKAKAARGVVVSTSVFFYKKKSYLKST